MALRSALIRFARDERGVTVIEYALIASLLSITIFAVVASIGTKTAAEFQKANDAFQ